MGKLVALHKKSVVIRHDAEQVRVDMTPANTPEEQAVFCHFDDAHSARAYADELLLVWGDIFGSVVDLTRGGVEL